MLARRPLAVEPDRHQAVDLPALQRVPYVVEHTGGLNDGEAALQPAKLENIGLSEGDVAYAKMIRHAPRIGQAGSTQIDG
jgi:hypothetical protein